MFQHNTSTTPPDPDAKLARVDDRDVGCLMAEELHKLQ